MTEAASRLQLLVHSLHHHFETSFEISLQPRAHPMLIHRLFTVVPSSISSGQILLKEQTGPSNLLLNEITNLMKTSTLHQLLYNQALFPILLNLAKLNRFSLKKHNKHILTHSM